MADAQVVRSERGNAAPAQAAVPFVRTGIAIYRGQELPLRDRRRPGRPRGRHGSGPGRGGGSRAPYAAFGEDPDGIVAGRRDLAAVKDELLWPDGIIPYVIDAGFTEKGLSEIEKAIHAWNSKTVITLVQRTTESDYVRFQPRGFRPSEPYCRANLGRKGGEQSIWLSSPDGCGVDGTIHEVGHAVGLVHEHQRHDRDKYITVADAHSYGDVRFAYLADTRVEGPSTTPRS